MADSPAIRAKRARAHRRGDHIMCRPESCPDAVTSHETVTRDVTHAHSTPVTGQTVTSQPPDDDDRPPGGGIETMARAFVDALPYAEGDPRRLLGELLVRLARRIDEDGAVPASVAQFRMMLPQLVEVPNQAAGVVDELRLRRAQRILDGFLAQAQ